MAIGSEVGGVRDSSFEAGAGYSDSDIARNVSASGNYNFELADFVAAGVAAELEHSYGEGAVVDSDRATVGVDLFARKFELGKLGLGYSRSYSRFDVPVNDDSIDQDMYSVSGEYYIGAFTLGMSRQSYRSEEADDFDAWFFSAAGYLSENTRVTASGAGMDAADLYGVNVEHQSGWFDNKASVTLGYSRSPDNDAISLGINYFFGNTVSLKVRDREFR